MGSSLLLIWELWLFVCGFVSPLVPLSLMLLLLLPCTSFSSYTLVFPLLCKQSLILLWIVALWYIFQISFCLQSCVFFCNRSKGPSTQLCTLPSCRGSALSLQSSLLLLQNFLGCQNWRDLSQNVGFSFFIRSSILSPPIKFAI